MRLAPLVFLFALTSPAAAQEVFDMAFPGAEVVEDQSESYSEMRVMTGYFDADEVLQSTDLEGETRRVRYEVGPDRSTLEVFRAYQRALADAAFEPIYECEGREACTTWSTLSPAISRMMAPVSVAIPIRPDVRYGSYERLSDGRREIVDVLVSMNSDENQFQVRWGSTEAEAL